MVDPRSVSISRSQARSVDHVAVERYRIPSIVLMENAGRQLADHAAKMLSREDEEGTDILCLVGPGNNGGDALCAARHLHLRGFNVSCHLSQPADQYSGDAKINLDSALAMGIPLIETLEPITGFDLIVDGLLGTGLTQAVRPQMAELIDWINSQTVLVLAADVPSGMDCDTGQPLGIAVEATETLTFVARKQGFDHPRAIEHTGTVYYADIGAPWAFVLDDES